ncbi:hypothetical protein [Enterococcus sp. AZ109]|uniref:hypothetical protein n=1 Tax=Enterococcus sp. AZ109 TaxID=2774634 RepID=UPI003F248255
MPETAILREKILEYKEENDLSYRTMALVIGSNKQEVYYAVTGKRTTKKSNLLLTKLLKAYGIS